MLPKKSFILVGAFMLPVFCCLIGVGAFALLNVAPPAEARASGQGQTQQEKVDGLRARLAELDERIRALRARLEAEQERVALAQAVRELMDKLELAAAGVTKEVSGLGQEIAAIEAALRSLESAADGTERRNPVPPANDPAQRSSPRIL
jgi:uncharacterized protein YlxW (UPF0749 family)